MPSEKEVMKALENVMDPELGISVVDMGLIYEVKIEDKSVDIKMTLTNPACPMASMIVGSVEEEVAKMPGVERVRVNLVFDPPWTPERIKGWKNK